jgi:predicted nucleic acid-binding protein
VPTGYSAVQYLLDTDVLIDALRGHEAAQQFIRAHMGALKVSVLTVAELHAGTRNRGEERTLVELLTLFPKTGVSEKIAEKAGAYRNRYGKSHGTGLVDALLAATAEAEGLTLATLNKKHYPMLDTVRVPYRKNA